MNKIWAIVGGVVVVALILIASLSGSFNSLVSSRNKVDQSWADVEAQYQRRFDLIPSLVASIDAVLKQEQTVFGNIADARRDVANVKKDYETAKGNYDKAEAGSEEKIVAAQTVDSAVRGFRLTLENYPVLASTQNVKDFQVSVEGTENRIAQARRSYNETVKPYNDQVQQFPGNIIAGIFGFKNKAFFKSDSGAEKRPEIKFNN